MGNKLGTADRAGMGLRAQAGRAMPVSGDLNCEVALHALLRLLGCRNMA